MKPSKRDKDWIEKRKKVWINHRNDENVENDDDENGEIDDDEQGSQSEAKSPLIHNLELKSPKLVIFPEKKSPKIHETGIVIRKFDERNERNSLVAEESQENNLGIMSPNLEILPRKKSPKFTKVIETKTKIGDSVSPLILSQSESKFNTPSSKIIPIENPNLTTNLASIPILSDIPNKCKVLTNCPET